jgi:uncharacterized protein YcaQ
MHNIYVTLSRLQDITIEDLQKEKYFKGALEYMNPNVIIIPMKNKKYIHKIFN